MTEQQNDKTPLVKLYEGVSKSFDIGTIEHFTEAMQDAGRRRKFYDNISKNLDIGEFEEFETKMLLSFPKSNEVSGQGSTVTSEMSTGQSEPSNFEKEWRNKSLSDFNRAVSNSQKGLKEFNYEDEKGNKVSFNIPRQTDESKVKVSKQGDSYTLSYENEFKIPTTVKQVEKPSQETISKVTLSDGRTFLNSTNITNKDVDPQQYDFDLNELGLRNYVTSYTDEEGNIKEFEFAIPSDIQAVSNEIKPVEKLLDDDSETRYSVEFVNADGTIGSAVSGKINTQKYQEDREIQQNLEALNTKDFRTWSDEEKDYYTLNMLTGKGNSYIAPTNSDYDARATRNTIEQAKKDKEYSENGEGFAYGLYHTLEPVKNIFKAFGRESTGILSGILGIPELVFDSTSEFLGSDYSYRNVFGKDPIRSYLDKAVERDEVYTFNREPTQGIVNSFKEGNYGSAIRQTADGFGGSLSYMATLMLGNAGALTAFASGASSKYQEYVEEGSNDDRATKLLKAQLFSLAEVVPERVGLTAIMKPYLELVKKEGREVATNILSKAIQKSIGRFTVLNAYGTELATETATLLIQNGIDGKPLTEGWDDMVVLTLTSTGALTAPAQLRQISVDKKNLKAVNEMLIQNEDILKSLDADGMTDETRASLSKIYTDNIGKINTYVEQEQERRGKLTKPQQEALKTLETQRATLLTIKDDSTVPQSVKTGVETEIQEIDAQIDEVVTAEEVSPQEMLTEEVQFESATEEEIAEIDKIASTEELGKKESFSKVVFNSDSRTNRIQELEQRLKLNSNLGIANDPKQEAQWMRDATEYAVLKIADGTVKSIKALAEILGVDVKNESLIKVYDDATKIREDLKQFEVPAVKQTVKKTIRESTEGGIKGEVKLSAKEALKQRIRTLNEGARLGKKNIENLRTEVTDFIKVLSGEKVFRGDVGARALRQIANSINRANTPAQVQRSLNVLEKVAEDIKFAQKIATISGLQRKLKAFSKSKNIPRDLAPTVKQFAKITLSDLEVNDLNTYYDLAEKLVNRNQAVANVPKGQLQDLIDKANQTKEDRADERKTKQGETANQIAKISSLREKLITDLGLSKTEVDAIDDATVPFENRVSNLQEAVSKKGKEVKEAKLREVAKQYQDAVEQRNFGNIVNPSEKTIVENAIKEGLLDSSKIPTEMLPKYISVMYNLLNNNSAVGLGDILITVKAQKAVSNTTEVNNVKSMFTTPAKLLEWLRQRGATTGSQMFDAIIKNSRNIGKIHNFFGMVDIQMSSAKTFKQVANVRKEFNSLVKKHRRDLDNNPVATTKLAVLSDVLQSRNSWTETEKNNEPTLRLKAWYVSLDRMREVNNSQFRKENKDAIKNLETALKEISTVTEVDGETTYEFTDDLNQLVASLPEGHKAIRQFMINSYAKVKDDFFAVSRVYGGLDVETDWRNYLPRTYKDIKSSDVRAVEKLLASGTGQVKDIDMLGQGFNSSVNKETTQAGQSRLISGANLPINKYLNTDVIGTFLSEIGRVYYDTNTMADRKFTTSMLDVERNGIKFDDTVPLDIYKSVVAQKIYGDKIQLGVPDLNPTLIKQLWDKTGKLGVVKALGGWAQYLKQLTPIIEVLGRLSNPTTLGEAISVLHRGEAKALLAMGDVSLRSLENEISAPKGSSTLSPAERSQMSKLLRKMGMTADQVTDAVADFALSPLKNTDALVANAGWLAFYIDYVKKSGNVVDLTTPNKEAIAYANTQNSIVMNESDASLQASLTKLPLMRYMFPFSSFSVNSKVTLINSISRAVREKHPEAQKRMVGEVGANIANIIAFNTIGYLLRYGAIQGGGYAMAQLLGMIDLDDEEREELLKELEKDKENRIALNDMRSVGYVAQDLMFGGLFGKFMEPAFTPVTDAVTEKIYGKDAMIARGFGANKAFGEKPLEDALGLLGAQGIYAKNALDLYKNLTPLLESPEEYIKKTQGEVNAEKTTVIVDSYYLDPNNIDNFDREEYDKATRASTVVFNGLAMFGFSDQTLNSTNRYTSSISKALLKKKGIQERTASDADLIKRAKDVTEIDFGGDLNVPLDFNLKMWYMATYPEVVAKVKRETPRIDESETEYERLVSGLAEDDMKELFIKNFSSKYDLTEQKMFLKKERKFELEDKKYEFYKKK